MNKHWLPLVCIAFAGCASAPKEDEAVKPLVTVKVAKAELADIPLTVNATASVFPREQANISPRITARIRELRVRKGDTVRAGQTLALLENADLIAQRSEAGAALADAQASLEKTTSGTLPSDIERARGQVATAEAAYQQAQKIYDRRKQLFDQGAIPGRELLLSETELSTTKTNYEVAKKSLDLLQNQSRDKDIRIAESRVAQARARIENIQAQLTFTELKSPFNGVITEQFAYPGDMGKPDAPVFTVIDMSTAVIRAQVPDTEASAVRTSAACQFTPSDHAQTITRGRVSMVNRAVDAARRTVEVWCEVPSPSAALRAGMFGTAAIITGTAPGSVVVPLTAVQFSEGTRNGSAMVVDDKKIAHKRDIECGTTVEGKVQVLKGLKEGETVVVEGGYGLPDGAQVQLAEPKAEK